MVSCQFRATRNGQMYGGRQLHHPKTLGQRVVGIDRVDDPLPRTQIVVRPRSDCFGLTGQWRVGREAGVGQGAPR